MSMQTITHTLEDTRQFAQHVVNLLKQSADINRRAVVLALSGPLGAGKTALTKCIAEILGVSDTVTSPTFVLRSDYVTDDSVFARLIHIDAYRLEVSEIQTIGWDDVITSPNTLVVVEWSERVVEHLPPDTHTIAIDMKDGVHTFALENIARTAHIPTPLI